MSRRRFLVGAGGALAAAGLTPVLPDWAALRRLGLGVPPVSATTGVVLDTANPLANFTKEGNQPFNPGPVLTLIDSANNDFITLFANDPDAAPGTELDLVVRFQVKDRTPVNADIGLRFSINDGSQLLATAACIINNGVNGIGISSGSNFTDPTNYAAFVVADWLAPTTLRFRRTAQGDAELMEVNGNAPNPRAFVSSGSLPPRNRTEPSVELGCTSGEAQATIDVNTFYSERPQPPVQGALTPTVLRIRDSDSTDKVRFRADYQLDAGAAAIDPTTQPVKVTLSTASAGVFYTKTISGFDVRGRAPNRRWTATAAARAAAGIDACVIDEDPNNSGSSFLRDVNTTVAMADFTDTSIEVLIGDDRLTGSATMVEKPIQGGGRWRLQSEP